MRFEQLQHRERRAFLLRLHGRINKKLFHGKLQTIQPNVENLDADRFGGDCYAMYWNKKDTINGVRQAISFSYEFIDMLRGLKTQKQQAQQLVCVLLHEMIHQYCAQNALDDTDHNQTFQQIAQQHGLHSVYSNGELVEQWLLIPGILVLYNLRIQ